MNRNKRIVFLLLINIGVITLALYLLDFLQILDYRMIFAEVPLLKEQYTPRIEDPYLLEKVELEKKWQLLEEKIKGLEEEKKKIEKEIRDINIEKENIAQEKENIKNMISEFERAQSEKESYSKRLDSLAEYIENMPPLDAVKIIEKQEDLMIIDLFKRMDERAKKAGRQSIVPYLISKMDPEQAARIQRKMLE
ncbi:MAG: periplasmic-type flagellar collar protein FlbB [Brevinematia bacterium]